MAGYGNNNFGYGLETQGGYPPQQYGSMGMGYGMGMGGMGGMPFGSMQSPMGMMFPMGGGGVSFQPILPQQGGGGGGSPINIKSIDGSKLTTEQLKALSGSSNPTLEAIGMMKGMKPNDPGYAELKEFVSDNSFDVGLYNWAGLGCSVLSTAAQIWIQSDLIDAQEDYQQKMYDLSVKWIDFQGILAEKGVEMAEGRNDLCRDLAAIQAEVEKHKADVQASVSIQNTKTAATYGYLSGKFYDHGSPAVPSTVYV